VEFIEKKGDVVELGLVRSEPRRRARRGGPPTTSTTAWYPILIVFL
jgi:hypothetical protein